VTTPAEPVHYLTWASQPACQPKPEGTVTSTTQPADTTCEPCRQTPEYHDATQPQTVPEAAIDAAMKAAPDQHVGIGHWEPVMSRTDMRRTLEAASPAMHERCRTEINAALELIAVKTARIAELEQSARQHHAERDLMHADLGDLLEATGLGDFARPQSPHEVMQQAIARVREIREERERLTGAIHAAVNAERGRVQGHLADAEKLNSDLAGRVAELETRLRDSFQTVHDLHADREHDEQRITELEQLCATQAAAVEECAGQVQRIAELEQLARDILTRYRYAIGPDHPDDVADEIHHWETTLRGTP